MSFHPTKSRDYGTTKELVARIIDECGGVKQAAFLGGRAVSQVYAYADPAVDAQMPLDIALRLSVASKSTTLAHHVAAISGGVFIPVNPHTDPLAELSAKSAKEHGALMASLIEALQDGEISGREKSDLLARIDQSVRTLVSARAKLAGDAA